MSIGAGDSEWHAIGFQLHCAHISIGAGDSKWQYGYHDYDDDTRRQIYDRLPTIGADSILDDDDNYSLPDQPFERVW